MGKNSGIKKCVYVVILEKRAIAGYYDIRLGVHACGIDLYPHVVGVCFAGFAFQLCT